MYVADEAENAIVRYPIEKQGAAGPDSILYLAAAGATHVYAIAVDAGGRLYVGAKTSVSGKTSYEVLVYTGGNGGGAFPLRRITVPAAPNALAVDARGFVYAVVGRNDIDIYPPSGSARPVRHIAEGGEALALGTGGTLYALAKRGSASSVIDVYDSSFAVERRICLGGADYAGLALGNGRVYVARALGDHGEVAWYAANDSHSCPPKAPAGRIEPAGRFVPLSIAVSGDRIFAANGAVVNELNALHDGVQKPMAIRTLLHAPTAVAAGPGVSSGGVETVTLEPTTQQLILPSVGGFRERLVLPEIRSQGATRIRIHVSTGGIDQTGSPEPRSPHGSAYAPLLEMSITAEGAAQLLNSPGFTIALPSAAPGNVEYFLSIFDPNQPGSSWFVGPGVLGGQSINFALGGTGVGLTFSAGETYEFELYALDVTSPTPSPMPTSGSITDYPISGNSVSPISGPITGPDGNQWFLLSSTNNSVSSLDSITPTGVVAAVALPQTDINSVAVGPDSNLWVSATTSGQAGSLNAFIDRVTTSGTVEPFAITCPSVPGNNGSICDGGKIATGSDGNIWMTNNVEATSITPGVVFQISPAGQLLQSFQLQAGAVPTAIVNGPDGALWIGASSYSGTTPTIQHLTTAGVLTTFSVPAYPQSMTVGQDGNVWFTDGGNNVDRITPQGVVTPFFAAGNAGTLGITMAADGTFWFVEGGTNEIGHMDETGAILGQYGMLPGDSAYGGISVSGNGNVWFSELNASGNNDSTFAVSIGVLTPPSSARRAHNATEIPRARSASTKP